MMRRLLKGIAWMLPAIALVAEAEEQRRPLLVEYVSPALLTSNDAPRRMWPEPELRVMAQPAVARGWEARRMRFESEFGLQDKQPNLIEGAKYQADRLMFIFKDFVEHSLNFDYELSNIVRPESGRSGSHRSRAYSLFDSLEHARLKSDIRLNSLSGSSFIGVKLILPIGN